MTVGDLQSQEYRYLKDRHQAQVELEAVEDRRNYLRRFIAQIDGAIEDCQLWLIRVEEGAAQDPAPDASQTGE